MQWLSIGYTLARQCFWLSRLMRTDMYANKAKRWLMRLYNSGLAYLNLLYLI